MIKKYIFEDVVYQVIYNSNRITKRQILYHRFCYRGSKYIYFWFPRYSVQTSNNSLIYIIRNSFFSFVKLFLKSLELFDVIFRLIFNDLFTFSKSLTTFYFLFIYFFNPNMKNKYLQKP